MIAELSAFAEKHQLHSPIAQVFEFEEADKALDALREFTGIRKIVVKLRGSLFSPLSETRTNISQ